MRNLPSEPQWQRGGRPNRRRRAVASGAWLKALWTMTCQVVAGVSMLGCLCLGVVGGHRLWQRAVAHPRLQVHHIDVTGTLRAHEADILSYAQAALNTPMLTLDMDGMALGVRRHPWVQSVQVRRQFPDRLSIEVAEHRPTLLVALGGLYVADEDGALFKSFATADHLDLPVLSGLSRDAGAAADGASRATTHAGRALTEQVREAIGLCRAIENHPASLGSLEELHWDQDVGWSAVLRPSHELGQAKVGASVAANASVRVFMGRQPLTRLPVVVETMQVLSQRHQTPKVIWADFVKNPKRVQVQLVSLRDIPPDMHASAWRRA